MSKGLEFDEQIRVDFQVLSVPASRCTAGKACRRPTRNVASLVQVMRGNLEGRRNAATLTDLAEKLADLIELQAIL